MQNAGFQLVLCLLAISLLEGLPYNCTRPAQECPSGISCDTLTGACDCPSTLEGRDCAIVKAQKRTRGCSQKKCLNGAVCLATNSRRLTCGCTPDYYGDLCEQYRYQLACSRTELLFNVNPVGTFSGTAYILDKYHVAACHAVAVPSTADPNDGIPDEWEGYYLRLDHDADTCGAITPTKDHVNQTVSFLRTLVISYNLFDASTITLFDDIFFGTCVNNFTVVVLSNEIHVHEETTTSDPSTASEIYRGSFFMLSIGLVVALL